MQTPSSLKRLCLALAPLVMGLSGCGKEPPPRTVDEFMNDEILLEAALVRCRQNYSELRFSEECINAREAVKIIEAREAAERRELLEAQSKRKREALRRTQQAAAEARRQMAEAERRRREAEYLAQFGQPMPPEDRTGDDPAGNAPVAIVPETADEPREDRDYRDPLAPTGDNAPAAVTEQSEPETQDLDAIRDELRRRNSESGSN
jgi:hypothetical protein